jgi:hypothetical protein
MTASGRNREIVVFQYKKKASGKRPEESGTRSQVKLN